MPVRLNGSTSGYTELSAPAVAGNNSIALPTGNGSAYQLLRNGATAGSLEYADKIVSGTAVASTSGTSIDFTSIPSWVKRVTVMFDGVSTNGSSPIMVQLGDAGGFEITGYAAGSFLAQQSQFCLVTQNTNGFTAIPSSGASVLLYGKMSIELLSSNTWLCFGAMWQDAGTVTQQVNAGRKALSATLNSVRITTVNGTDTFDAGSINLLWE